MSFWFWFVCKRMQRGFLTSKHIRFNLGRQTVVSLSCTCRDAVCFAGWQEKDKDRLQWYPIYHSGTIKLKDSIPNAKNWDLIYLLNGPYVTSVVCCVGEAWHNSSVYHPRLPWEIWGAIRRTPKKMWRMKTVYMRQALSPQCKYAHCFINTM